MNFRNAANTTANGILIKTNELIELGVGGVLKIQYNSYWEGEVQLAYVLPVSSGSLYSVQPQFGIEGSVGARYKVTPQSRVGASWGGQYLKNGYSNAADASSTANGTNSFSGTQGFLLSNVEVMLGYEF